MTKLRAARPMNRVRFPTRAERPDQSWGPLGVSQGRQWNSFAGGKQPEHEADHSAPFRADFKNVQSGEVVAL